MQAQYVGPVMVNGQMMNLFSINDFLRDAGKVINDVADVGKTVTDTVNQVLPIWEQIHKDSYNQYGGHISNALDTSNNILNISNNVGDKMQGMYLPDLPFNQQQQLQQLGLWDDVKNFGRQVGQQGQKIVKHTSTWVDPLGDAWSKLHSRSYDKHGDAVIGGIKQGLDTSGQIFDYLAKLRQMQQQQQLQQLGFFDDLKSFGREVGKVGKEITKHTGKGV